MTKKRNPPISRLPVLLSIVGSTVAAASLTLAPTRGAPPIPTSAKGVGDDEAVTKFMRRKLEASSGVLEGLVTENFSVVRKGARTMASMSRATDWETMKMPVYVQYSNQFRKICSDLEAAAEDEDVDAAGLAYVRLTMSCISCHKFCNNFVRKIDMTDRGTSLKGKNGP